MTTALSDNRTLDMAPVKPANAWACPGHERLGAEKETAAGLSPGPLLANQAKFAWAEVAEVPAEDTDTLASYDSDAEDFIYESPTLTADAADLALFLTGTSTSGQPSASASSLLTPKPTPRNDGLASPAYPKRSKTHQGVFLRLDTQLPDLRKFWHKPAPTPAFVATHGFLAPEQVIAALSKTL